MWFAYCQSTEREGCSLPVPEAEGRSRLSNTKPLPSFSAQMETATLTASKLPLRVFEFSKAAWTHQANLFYAFDYTVRSTSRVSAICSDAIELFGSEAAALPFKHSFDP